MHFEFTEPEVIALKAAAAFALREGIEADGLESAAVKLGVDLTKLGSPDWPDSIDRDVINSGGDQG